MDTVENIFAQARQMGAQPVSFEIFPPKGELSMESARTIAQELAKLDPAFISVTYSAGGSGNKQATAEIAAMIQDDHDVPAVAHLTCAGASQQSISTAVADMKDRGIRNVLALRGDLPEGYEPGISCTPKILSRCWRTPAFAWALRRIPRATSIAIRFD